MNAFRRTCSALNQCKRTVWKFAKENCVPPCMRRRNRTTNPEIEEDDVSRVSSTAVPKSIAKKRPARNNCNSNDFGRPKIETADDELDVSKKEHTRDVTKTDGKKKRRRARHRKGGGESRVTIKPLQENHPIREEIESVDTKPNDPIPSNSLDLAITKGNTDGEKTATKTINVYLPTNNNVQLNNAEKAWVPAFVARERAKAAGKAEVGPDDNTTEEVIKKVRSYLNKIAPDNIDILIKSFKELPITTVECLENVVDLIFKKAIQELNFAPRYAALCWALQSVQVSCTESKQTTSFKLILIKKCQSLFESDKGHQAESAKRLEEINSCTDPEKKKELLLEHEENEKRFHDRSLANCRFIGELFNRQLIHSKILSYCITYLISRRSEDALEYLCTLLKTTGKVLEQSYNLDCTFGTLKSLTSVKYISTRTKFIILDLLDLRKNKWIPKVIDCPPKVACGKEGNVSSTNAAKGNGIICSRCNRSGHLYKDCYSRDGNGEYGHEIKCYNCNRNGHISRDCREKERCYRCDGVGHLPRDCPKSLISCFNCRKNGHIARNCPDRHSELNTSSVIVCSNCNKVGHFLKDCTESGNCGDKYSLLCGNCDDSWHLAHECPKDKSKTEKGKTKKLAKDAIK